MPGQQTNIVNTPITADAQKRVVERVHEFGASLLLEAKLCSTVDRSGLVLPKHIDEALDRLNTKKQTNPRRELRIVFGGAFFGAFVQGFITEVAAQRINPVVVAVYTMLGLVGLFLVLWDLRR